jgi:hypothetical protein
METSTEIGQVLGISARKTGSILKEYNLRDIDGSPSEKSIKENYSFKIEPKDSKDYYLWNGVKVITY